MKKLFLGLFSLIFISNFNLNSTSPAFDVSGNNISEIKDSLFLEKMFSSLIEQNKLLIEQMIKQNQQKEIPKVTPTTQSKKSILSKICGETVDTFKYFVDKSDKLISKKGVIAMLLLIAPVIYLYHNYINDKTLPQIMSNASNAIGHGAIEGGSAVAKGAINGGLVEVVKNNKITAAKVVGVWFGLSTLSEVIKQTANKIGINIAPKLYDLPYNLLSKALLTLPLIYQYTIRHHLPLATIPPTNQINID